MENDNEIIINNNEIILNDIPKVRKPLKEEQKHHHASLSTS